MKQGFYYILLLLFFFVAGNLNAQQAPIFTQYYSTYMFSNPAYAGMREAICVNGLWRQQWAGGFEDADGNTMSPIDYLITLDSPIKLFHGGIGGSILQDRIGYWSDIVVQLDYSFHLDLSIGTLGIGAGINLINRSIDFTKYEPVVEDPILPQSNQSDLRVDASAGLFLSMPENYYFGFSVADILETGFPKFDPSGEAISKADRTFYLVGGYTFGFRNQPLIEIQPSFMILNNAVSTQYNLSAIVTYNNRFWGGLNYRYQESIDFIAGVSFKDFRVAFSYDLTTNSLGLPGSFEIGLGYCFKLKLDNTKTSYKNTRYL